MKCPKCHADNRRAARFCGQCGAPLAPGAPVVKPAALTRPDAARTETPVTFWTPNWRWHLKALLAIYSLLVVVYFAVSAFLSKVPEPHRMRDIPKEMTPWLKN
jgi:hypothetical protein